LQIAISFDGSPLNYPREILNLVSVNELFRERGKCGLSIATKSEASGETVFGFLSSILIVSADRKPTFAKTLTKTLIVAGGSAATRHKC
jgi:hypothetical protein